MTQFKDKSSIHKENINVGLFSYPVLQAADILLYQADLVPVGEDQKQHIELARNIAQRFNHYYYDTFTLPEPYITKIGARIMSLQEPTKKMSKSDTNEKNVIFLTDSDEIIVSKIKKSLTDSTNEVRFAPDKLGVSNLITIYSTITNKTISDIETEFSGVSYSEFKLAVADKVVSFVSPLRKRFFELQKNKIELENIIKRGAEIAGQIANKTLRKVQKKVGLLPLP